MNSVYFPIPGREVVTPKMFADASNLENILDKASEEVNVYLFVLDRACNQFEPDDPLYISVVSKVYDKIEAKRHYDLLKSTRHFGPLTFYLVRMRMLDNLLLHSIQNKRLDIGIFLFLYSTLNELH